MTASNMPAKHFGALDGQPQAVFFNGMVSPPLLEDMMFASQSAFQDDGLEYSLDTAAPDASTGTANAVDLPHRLQTLTNSKQFPPRPTSVSQPAVFASEDQANLSEATSAKQSDREYSSILDRPEKSSQSRQASFDRQDRNKKQRRTSEASVSEKEKEGKDRSREKNKIAAAKCRAKKRDNMDMIETNHRTLSAENSLLRRQEQQLRTAVAQLRTLALDHQNCKCGVHQYNMLEAKKLAEGLGGICSGVMDDRRRKGSDPIVANEYPIDAAFHSRSHSFSGSFGVPSFEDFQMHTNVFADQSFFEYDTLSNDHKLDA